MRPAGNILDTLYYIRAEERVLRIEYASTQIVEFSLEVEFSRKAEFLVRIVFVIDSEKRAEYSL